MRCAYTRTFIFEVDLESWLAAGYTAELPVLVGSERIYLEPEGPAYSRKRVVARYAGSRRIRMDLHKPGQLPRPDRNYHRHHRQG